MRIARLPFDEDLVTETFLLRFAISEFTIVVVWNYAVYLSSPGIYTFLYILSGLNIIKPNFARLVQSAKSLSPR